MFGYVTGNAGEMKMRDYRLYNGYYCGVCRSIAARLGQAARLTITFDAAFLAVLLAAGDRRGKYFLTEERCPVHPVQPKPAVRGRAVDYAADVLIALADNKAKDDIRDGSPLRGGALGLAVSGAFRRVRQIRPGLCQVIGEQTGKLHELEEARTPVLDSLADTSGRIMESVCGEFPPLEEKDRRLLGRLGYQMGRWIYIIDAADDLEDDLSGSGYNPLADRYGFDPDRESQKDFSFRVHDSLSRSLYASLEDMAKSLELFEPARNGEIIRNVVYSGLRLQTERILAKLAGKPMPDGRGIEIEL